jgi:Pyrimidine dimer DNA glycosylase
MRLWSLHPQYLDAQGLVALWREALLAQAVLRGLTKGYKHHPQLHRFRDHPRPISAINQYLHHVHAEAVRRHYSFDAGKIGSRGQPLAMSVASGQLEFEWDHLLQKLKRRSPVTYRLWRDIEKPSCHPVFRRVKGPLASWEKSAAS